MSRCVATGASARARPPGPASRGQDARTATLGMPCNAVGVTSRCLPQTSVSLHRQVSRRGANAPWSALLLAAAAVVVLLGWLLTPHPVPLYDGVGFPDEPYRYVQPPSASLKTAKAPGSDAVRVVVAQGMSATVLSLSTGESGPQAMVSLPPGSAAAATGPIEASLRPEAPTDPPRGQVITGNVYDFAATAGGAPVRFTQTASKGLIVLRAPNENAHEVLVFRTGKTQPWKAQPTSRVGRDIWAAAPPGPGEYALVASSGQGTAAGAGSSSGIPFWVWLTAAGPIVLIGAVVLLRVTSPERRAQRSASTVGERDSSAVVDDGQ